MACSTIVNGVASHPICNDLELSSKADEGGQSWAMGISGSTVAELATVDPNTAKAALEQWAALTWPAMCNSSTGAADPGPAPNTTSQRTCPLPLHC